MQINTLNRLLDINRQFYQSFGKDFSATRRRLQPGVQRVLKRLTGEERILDLGCGNGELARQLALADHRGSYLGLDFSSSLLALAEDQPATFPVKFLQVDLTSPDWEVAIAQEKFDLVFSFAAFHHIPGLELRLQFLKKIHRLLNGSGSFIHSHWQFLNSPRLKDRIQPWQTIGIDPEDLDPGDYLLDWKHGGYGLRYVHHFSEEELVQLAESTGFQVMESFLSDGKGGNLSLYQVWKLDKNA